MKAVKRSIVQCALFIAIGIVWNLVGTPQAQSAESPALTGTVSSDKEGQMEGVLVSAKKVGGTITVTVVSDDHGRYAFPASRLQPGTYNLKIRAVGYDIVNPGTVTLEANNTKELNLKLQPTRNVTAQLSTIDWLMSAPGTPDEKVKASCMVGCHQFAVAARTSYTSDELQTVIQRMRNYAPASINVPGDWVNAVKLPVEIKSKPSDVKIAQYISSVNLSNSSDGKWSYDVKPLPRLKGDSTKIIITEYDLPRRGFEPHDVMMDPDGMVWTADFGAGNVGRLDPHTGDFKEWKVPVLKSTSPSAGLELRIDKDGNPWFSMMQQGGVAEFDKKTQEVKVWPVPQKYDNPGIRVGMVHPTPDGKVYFKDSANEIVHKLDPKTGQIDSFQLPHEFYGMGLTSHGDLVLSSLEKGSIGVVDGETGKFTDYPTPTPNSGSRRGEMDKQDHYWFGESYAGRIGMFDIKTRAIKEWALPYAPFSDAYDAMADIKGDVWAAGEFSDYVYRLNPSTGKIVMYLLPTLEANIRRISMDNSTNSVAVWMGENHHAKIAKLEPLN